MSKWVEVPVTILKTYAVETGDNETIEDAVEYVSDDCFGDIEIHHKICTIAETEQQAKNIKIMADEILKN